MSHIEARLEDIPFGQPFRIEHEGTGVVILRTGEGVAAFYDSCPHAHWRLSEGQLNGNVLECPGHGWQFDAGSGRCLDVPTYCLRPVVVTICGDTLRIDIEELGEPHVAKACQEDEAFV